MHCNPSEPGRASAGRLSAKTGKDIRQFKDTEFGHVGCKKLGHRRVSDIDKRE